MLLSLVLFAFIGASLAQPPEAAEYFGGGGQGTAYLDWLNSVSYNKSTFIGSSGKGVAVLWTLNEMSIKVAVAANATGWVGFGIADAGSMLGADIVMFTAETNELVDSYVLDQLVTPIPDDCQSWTLLNSVASDGFIIFEATRLLDTGDSQDHVIIDDSSTVVPSARVIAAWGDDVSPSYHGENRARGAIRFYGDGDELAAFQEIVQAEQEGSFDLLAKNYSLPSVETDYRAFCFSEADLIAMGVPTDISLHGIGIEPIVDASSAEYVHHFVLIGSELDWDPASDCDEEFPGFELAYVWAPGDKPLNLPPNVGTPLGEGGFKSFHLEIHYNNPSLDTGKVDNSGVRFYYTSQKREYDLGVLQVGDPNVELFDVEVGNGLSQHSFECAGTCSTLFLDEPVTVIHEHLHMHASGESIFNEQIRDGNVIRTGRVQYWDFDQQGNQAVAQTSFEIQPGDGFKTTCNYNPTNGERFGLGSADEMCIAFLFYFPRQLLPDEGFGEFPWMCGLGFESFLPGCGSAWTQTALTGTDQLGRTFGFSPLSCPAEPSPSQLSGSPVAAPSAKPSISPVVSPAMAPTDSSTVLDTGTSSSSTMGRWGASIVTCVLAASYMC